MTIGMLGGSGGVGRKGRNAERVYWRAFDAGLSVQKSQTGAELGSVAVIGARLDDGREGTSKSGLSRGGTTMDGNAMRRVRMPGKRATEKREESVGRPVDISGRLGGCAQQETSAPGT